MSAQGPNADLAGAAAAGDPQAQYRLGADALHRQQFAVAEQWLQRAADSGLPAAQNALAAVYLYGLGVKSDALRALALYDLAAAAGHVDACFTLANLYFTGVAADRDHERTRQLLRTAASQNHPGALRVLGFIQARQQPGGPAAAGLASACFVAAAMAGDPLAMHLAGMSYLCGHGVEVHRGRARHWLECAANAGIPLSARRLLALADVTGEPSPAPAGEDIRSALDFDWPDHAFAEFKQICAAPRIGFVDDVLTAQECEYLMMLAEPQLTASLTLNPATGRMLSSSLRTSRSMNFQPIAKDIVLHLIERRLAALAGVPVDHAEPLAVLHYRPNEEYKPHYDYFTPEAMAREKRLSASGQRLVTTFVYLTDVERGGGTDFPRLMKTVEPKRGRALLMHNCDAEGRPDRTTLHAGLPVIAGEKWLVTLWFRERPFVLV